MNILKFGAAWCNPCKQLESTFQAANLSIDVNSIDVDVDTDMVSRYNVRGVPTIILMQGDIELARTQGYKTVSQLKSFIDANA